MLSDAGAWLARMNGPLRTPATEEGFRQWLRDEPKHAEAFRILSEDWEEMDELKRFAHVAIGAPEQQTRRTERIRPVLAIAAALTLAVVSGLFYYLRDSGIGTDIGEQRILTLEDGTKVSLNTATHIVVSYDKSRRTVRLDSGEALFEVVKDVERPFVVIAGRREIVALGTSFVVRRDSDRRLAVTLVEGKVAVGGQAGADRAVTLAPGQRLVLTEGSHPVIDRPAIDKVTAWQQGKVAIDHMRLSDAVAEMNRYSPLKLVIERPESKELLLSGVFTAGQSVSFARAVAQSYGLKVVEQGDTLVLAGLASIPD